MSFSSITEITGLFASQDNKKYHISNVDIKLDLGGGTRVSFVVLGEANNTNKIIDLSKLVDDDPTSAVYFKQGSWVTLTMTYRTSTGGKDISFDLFSGRVRGMTDSMRLTGTTISMGRGYILTSDLEFVGKLPLGSLFVPAAGKELIPSVMVGLPYQASVIGKLVTNGTNLNVAKLAADLIDIKTTNVGKAGVGVTADVVSSSERISDRVNLDNAPLLDAVLVNNSIGNEIMKQASRGYTTTPPMTTFKDILSRFFLICAPRTDGRADVVENNGWKKVNSDDLTLDLGYDNITGVTMFDASGLSPGFDGVAVNITSSLAGNGGQSVDAHYVICSEVFNEDTGRAELISGEVTGKETKDGLHLIGDGGKKVAVGRVRVVHLSDWMRFVDLSKISNKGTVAPQALRTSCILWAKWLAYGAYAELNRIANRATLDLRLTSYMDLANRLGEVVSFNVPGYSEKYYGRLASIGFQISMSANQFSGKTSITLDCVRDAVDNENLCIDFSLYKGK